VSLLILARWVVRLCWIVLCGVWLVTWLQAPPSGPAKRAQSLLSRLAQYPLYVLGTILIFASKLVPLGELDERLLPRSDALTVVALGLTVAGVAFAIWARVTLGANWSGRAVVKGQHQLIQSGPYRWVRHPIYTGLLVAFLGTALLRCAPRTLLGVATFAFIFSWKMVLEERLLAAEYGERYQDYRRRVKALIPFVL